MATAAMNSLFGLAHNTTMPRDLTGQTGLYSSIDFADLNQFEIWWGACASLPLFTPPCQ
jgi:hypothetical protein